MSSSPPRLIVRDAQGNTREIKVAGTPFTIGRQADSDLVLLDNRVSRRHAQILRDTGSYILEDTSSRHGTYVNGQRVERWRLKSGDRISLGASDSYRLTFVSDEAELNQLLKKIEKAPESSTPRLQHLNLLLEIAQMLQRAAALEDILTAVVDSALQLSGAERGILFLVDEHGEPQLRLVRPRPESGQTGDPDYSEDVVRRVMRTRRGEVLMEGAGGGSAYETVMLSSDARGVVAIPLQKLPVAEAGGETLLRSDPELLGVLYLESRSRSAALTHLDRQALDTLAIEGAMIIENARLLRAAREQERSRHEMAVAQSIQQSLLPRALPQAAHFRLHAVTIPCRTIGGDYYDVIPLPHGRLGLNVADVSGKGLPAAMLAMTLQGAFSALAAADPGLEDLFQQINRFLCERTPPEMYATLFYGVLDASGGFEFVSAGHVPPLCVHTGGYVEVLDAPGFPLGMLERATFQVSKRQLDPGDQILVFSDGVTEAQNDASEMLGDERLLEIVQACASNRVQPEELCTRLVTAVETFVGSAPQADDVTVAVLRYAPAAT